MIVARDTTDDLPERLEIASPCFQLCELALFSRVTLSPRFGANIALTLDGWSAMFNKDETKFLRDSLLATMCEVRRNPDLDPFTLANLFIPGGVRERALYRVSQE